MGILEVITAILLIISCIYLILTVLMQDSKKGIGGALTGGSSDNYFQKNAERSKESRLKRHTRFAAILIFVLILVVNIAETYATGDDWLSSIFNEDESDSDSESTAAQTPQATAAQTSDSSESNSVTEVTTASVTGNQTE